MALFVGRATAESTRRSAGAWGRPLGATGLTCSALGFGSYRIEQADNRHLAALEQALLTGHVNLIDTAANYTGGRSERAVGRALAHLFNGRGVAREDIVVVTKAGYWQGEMLSQLKTDELRAGRLPYRLARLSEDHWHSIDPDLVERALETSLRRMGLEFVDVMLLHNPERLLSAPGDQAPLDERRDAFYEHVGQAFARLEELVDKGVLGWYGVSSNTLASEPSEPDATDLERFVAAAREIGGDDHHLAVVQLPLNAGETAALSGVDGGPSVLERCAEHGLGVLVNRPLNAFVEGRLLRLAELHDEDHAADFAPARHALAVLEDQLAREQGHQVAATITLWSHEIPIMLPRFGSAAQFDDVRPQLDDAIARELDSLLDAVPAAAAWLQRYQQTFARLCRAARASLAFRDREHLEPLVARLDTDGVPAGTLSQRAAAWAATRPGVSAALIGMRRPEYVTDACAIGAWPQLAVSAR